MQAATAATAKFQLNDIPLALASVSSGLAALHASRARLLHPSHIGLRTSHCPKCGSLYANGGTIRSVRLRKRRKRTGEEGDRATAARIVRKSCGTCDHQEDLAAGSGNASLYPQPRKQARQPSKTSDASVSWVHPNIANMMAEDACIRPSVDTAKDASECINPSPSSQPPLSPIAQESNGRKTAPSTPASPTPSRTQARSKKSLGLQGLLARNRQRQEQEKKRTEHGLATFLQELT
ncbi:hypothetical protein AcW1_004822 [Taiwanofungus camphoratus]|nr:hypothetical protein AcV7_003380 [Antrodia cinnamomea]KAI0939974.1 hypothetical protein AcV5_001206 [Antrodia cinnamomea]KAI0960260.1 hypothetical protein AcW1_004822 [Antrodia cinnamomea]